MANREAILRVEGMSCNHCVNAIRNEVGKLNGVITVEVDLDSKKVLVEFDDERISEDTIKDVIDDQGYKAV